MTPKHQLLFLYACAIFLVTGSFISLCAQGIAESEPNNTLEEANAALLSETYTGHLGTGDDSDWYRLEIDRAMRLSVIDTTSGTLSYKINIYDVEGDLMVSGRTYSDNSGITPSLSLLPGTWYVRFWRDWSVGFGGDGDYFFSFQYEEVPMDTEPNNSFEEAGTIQTGVRYTGNLGHKDQTITDDYDYYKLTLDQAGRIIVYDTTSNTLGYQVHIYDHQGDDLGGSGHRYSDNSGVNAAASLTAGTYYILFWRRWSVGFSGDGGYSFQVNYTSVREDPEPNDTRETAAPITPEERYYGNLGHQDSTETDDYDYYRFTLSEPGKVTVFDTSSNKLGYEVYFYDIEGHDLGGRGFRYSDGSGKEALNHLEPGPYYLLFWRHWSIGFSGTGEYNFVIDHQPVPADPEYNDSIHLASPVAIHSVIEGNLGHQDSLRIDNFDCYVLNLEKDGKLMIHDTTYLGLSYQLYLYDENRQVVTSVNRYSDNSGPRIERNLTAGTYYIVLWRRTSLGFGGAGKYMFGLGFIPMPIPRFTFHYNRNEVKFTNLSEGAETYHWEFGDGTASNQGNPSHLYTEPGDFIVTLSATNEAGTRNISDTVVIYGLREFSPRKGGNNGQVTLTLLGGGMSEETTVTLSDGGNTVLIPLSVRNTIDAVEAVFDLNGTEPGIYDLVVTTPGREDIIREDAFEIEAGGEAKPWVHLSGRTVALLNRWSTYTIEFGNSGNLDAEIVPVFITISDPEHNEVMFPDLELLYGDFAVDNQQEPKLDSLPDYFDLDSIWDEPNRTRVFAYYIPRIPAGFSGSLTMKVKTTSNIRINVWNTEPLMENGMLKSTFSDPESQFAKCLYDAKVRAALDLGATYLNFLLPGSSCIYSIGKEFYTIRQMRMESFTKRRSWGDFTKAMTSLFLSCIGDVTGIGKIYELAIAVTSTVTFLNDAVYLADKECREKFGKQSLQRRRIRGVYSYDPNEINGPSGYGDKNYIAKSNAATYTIFFENKDTASAPAQEIWVTDTLDKNVFDMKRFSFNAITIGDSIYHFPNGQSEIGIDIDYRPNRNLVGRAVARLDTVSGILSVYLTSLEPETLFPNEDPALGILPPNVNAPEGEGSVTFTIGLRDLQNEECFSNRATIVFDFNQPITTNTWSNTIDDNKPVSEVSSYTFDENSGIVELQVVGDDDGAGLELMTVFVSINDDAWHPIGNSTDNLMHFQAVPGTNNYKFFSIASDSLGHIEEPPADFDIETNLTTGTHGSRAKRISIYPQPAGDHLYIEAPAPDLTYRIFSTSGRKMMEGRLEEGVNMLDVSGLQKGLWIIKIGGSEGTLVEKVVLSRD
ncbi:MAG: T9SS type A sorting domain-containing protein [Bacteroidales bacterium]|nr:T9SS type A sorting domain-containing protein [Bacteroidales bacterium]